MRFFRSPAILKFLLRSLEWNKPQAGKTIYLTFDDGPIPEITDFVLAQLARYQAQATFFCVGENVNRYPEITNRVVAAGHQLGNHTFNHLKAWKTKPNTYLANVSQCHTALKPWLKPTEKPLFRPPYGQVTSILIKQLLPQYRIVMWDLITYDFDATLSPEMCLQKSIAKTKPGSIVVFHDSLKARRNLEFVLPRYLAHFHRLGYQFKSL